MKTLSKILLSVIFCLLLFVCKEREPLNPLDPNNPYTHGQEYTIKAEVTGIGKVKVHWNKVNQSQVKGYRLYRTIHDAEPSLIAETNDTLFLNTGLQAGITCSYFYRLLWEDGREIHQSPSTTPLVTFNAPTGLTITKQSRDRVEMQWNNLQWLDNYSYCRIYRNTDGTFILYDSTSSNQYIDTNVGMGITYRYKVAAVASDGTQSNLSDEGYATPGNNPPIIDSLKASQPFTNWGEEVTITCYAHDEDGDPITYEWEALDGGIIIVSGQTVTFRVPEDSQFTHRIKVTAHDNFSSGNQNIISIESMAQNYNFLVSTKNGLISIDENGDAKNFTSMSGKVEVYNDKIYVLKNEINVLNNKGDYQKSIPIPSEVLYYIEYTSIRGQKFALLDNYNDKIYFIDSLGNYLKTVNIIDTFDNSAQNLDGVVLNDALIISENGRNQIIKIDLTTYTKTIFKDLSHLTDWLGAIDYRNGVFYICQSRRIYSFAEGQTEKLIATLPEGNITGIVILNNYAYVTINFSGRIYKVNILTGLFSIFTAGLNYPEDIEISKK